MPTAPWLPELSPGEIRQPEFFSQNMFFSICPSPPSPSLCQSARGEEASGDSENPALYDVLTWVQITFAISNFLVQGRLDSWEVGTLRHIMRSVFCICLVVA